MSKEENKTFDAIVVGSGISGGWAAKELTEGGLKTLVLERGKEVEHIKDYKTAMMHPWEFKYRMNNSVKEHNKRPVQSSHCNETNRHFYVNDTIHPYVQINPFKWIRGYQVGGRSLTWGRQCYRFSDLDFTANKKDNIGVDWPIRYKDLEVWYSYIEDYIGISGKKEGIPHLPDSNFLPPIEMNSIEQHLSREVTKCYENIKVIHGRVANLTSKKNGRGPCQFRNLCSRGCPYTGYFSSNGVTLPAAKATGNLTLKANSIVKEVLYDNKTKKAIGVLVIDAINKTEILYYAKIIFLNASTIATASILLNSKSKSFPNGLGNSSGQIGHNLMDHVVTAGTEAEYDGFEDEYYSGRNPGAIYIPRFQNLKNETLSFIRGYGLQGKGERKNWQNTDTSAIGKELKGQLAKPGKWKIWLGGRGEVLPRFENKISLSKTEKDEWGLPIIEIDFTYSENENKMIEHMKNSSEEILKKAGFKNIRTYSSIPDPGSAVHEMGTARMGNDPNTSVLNKYNQMHDVPNVYITDGSCMTSSGCQNPSLTYMALTARACKHALSNFNKTP